MSIQKEIREEVNALIGNCLIAVGCGGGGCPRAEIKAEEAQEECLEAILKYLDSKDVTVSVLQDQKLYEADVYFNERLIDET